MAQGSNTFDRYDLGSGATDNVREQLSEVISNISPTSLPFCANSGVDSSRADYEEWQTDTLAAAATNAHLDGDQFSAESISRAIRVGNFHQIGRKEIQVSFRANVVDKAGRDNEMSYQMAKRGKELRRDVEFDAIRRNAAVQGTASTAAETAGAPAWLRSNTQLGGSGAAPGTSGSNGAGYPNSAGTVGSKQALTQADILAVIRSCYSNGSVPNMILLGPLMKERFSTFMFTGSGARTPGQRQDQGKSSGMGGVEIIGAVDTYVSDFGRHDIVPDLFIQESDSTPFSEVLLLNTEFWKITYLRRFQFIPQPNDGDAERELLLVDWAVKAKNEASSGVVAAVDSNAVMTAA